MPGSNCHIQYASCMLIAVPLNAACQIVTGAASIVTSGFTEFNWEPEIETGTDYSAKNFGGQRCGPDLQGADLEKWQNMTGSMCLVHWGLQAMATGNPLVVDDDGNTVGYQELIQASATDTCSDAAAKPRMAIAVIRKAAVGDGGCAAVTSTTGATGLSLHVFPNQTNYRFTDNGAKDERNVRSFTGRGYANPQIGAGPFNLWPAAYTPNKVDPDSVHSEAFIAAGGLPAIGCDTVVHPAPAVRT